MIIQTEPCQHCGSQQVEAPWTLCRDCRRVYAKTLHRLRHDMMLLQQVSLHAYKLGEPGAGGKPQGGAAPAPINLHAQDMLDQTEDGLQDMWNETGVESRPRWQALLRDAPRRLPDLCRASRSGHWLTWLIHACERIEPLIDRRPRTRRIIGVCPECGREVLAAKGDAETLQMRQPRQRDRAARAKPSQGRSHTPHQNPGRHEPMAQGKLRVRGQPQAGRQLAQPR